jgi:VWFA-related protein
MAKGQGLLALLSMLVIEAVVSTPPQDRGQVRAGVTAVPIDVRVLDRNGRPITDLQRADFTVFEDGVPQTTTHFSTQAYGFAGSVDKGAAVSLGSPADVPPQRRFLIVLGRGPLEGPARGLTGVVRFLKSDLLPTDLVAVLAFKRITDFSKDRQPFIRLLERYRTEHEAIEKRLYQPVSSDDARAMIDALLIAPGMPGTRELPFALQGNVGQLYTGIEHLRALDGEKHLIFLTAPGLNFGRRITSRLTQMAADARVTISPIQTSGTPSRAIEPGYGARRAPAPVLGRSTSEAFNYADLRKIAEDTGGVSAAYEYARDALERLRGSTSFQYLLGYQPSNGKWDGKHRQIEVRVNRPGATVMHRHSYYAGPAESPQDRARLIAESRIASAGEHRNAITDIRITVSLRSTSATNPARLAPGEIGVDVGVDIATLRLETAAGVHSTSLVLAIFCADGRENVVGEVWRQVEVALSDESLKAAAREGFRTSVPVPVSSSPAYVKAVVYERSSDRVGSAILSVK